MSGALVICGPTSSGKSAVALGVARALGGEIINADSRQIYRGMSIGTGMPPATDLALVPHHLYAFLDPGEIYSAARFAQDASAVTSDVTARGRVPIVVGGTGFYIEALAGTMPLDRPPGDEALRARLRDEARLHPPEVLRVWVEALAPARAQQIMEHDSYRILRGLEVALAQRDLRAGAHPREPLRATVSCEIVVLHVPRAVLRSRIAARAQSMFDHGLVDEARAVRQAAPSAPALSGLGYAEALALCDGLATRNEAIVQTVRRTNAYAKRQQTWFRRMRSAFSVDAEDVNAAIHSVITRARERLALA